MSSANSAANEAKTQGGAAWSAGDYPKAIEQFSQAISLASPDEREFLKVLYSNRSAAYLKTNKATESLADATKCVELDSNWAKGYVRKGDALSFMKKHTDAYNAYNSAQRMAPNDALITEKCESAMRGIRNAASPPRSSGANAPMVGLILYLRMAAIILAFLYLIPLGYTISTILYK